MKISKRSRLTGVEHTMDIEVTSEQLDQIDGGRFVQDVCPHLSPGEREFLITGITPEEWDRLIGSDEDD